MREIFARIAAHTDEYLARLKRACAQPSISAQGEGLAEMADLVAEMLRDVGRSVELVPTGGAPVVLGQMQGWGTLFVPQILQTGSDAGLGYPIRTTDSADRPLLVAL
jgi:acetylornithine deacetylase/succinyl-diaminopimelate desuccinylase-like protein